MKQPVLIDTRFLRPLPKAMWGVACMICNKTQANWSLHETSAPDEEQVAPVCAICFLYDSAWGKKNSEGVSDLIREAEERSGEPFLRGKGQRLMHSSDADRILSAVALISKITLFQRLRNKK